MPTDPEGRLAQADEMEVREPRTEAEIEQYHDLRWRLLRAPQGEPPSSERKGIDHDSVHLIATIRGRVIGAGCLRMTSRRTVQHRQIAVDPEFQRTRVGTALGDEMFRRAVALGAKRAFIYARVSALPYFEKRGFYYVGPAPDVHPTIEHVLMQKAFSPRRHRLEARLYPRLHPFRVRARRVRRRLWGR